MTSKHVANPTLLSIFSCCPKKGKSCWNFCVCKPGLVAKWYDVTTEVGRVIAALCTSPTTTISYVVVLVDPLYVFRSMPPMLCGNTRKEATSVMQSPLSLVFLVQLKRGKTIPIGGGCKRGRSVGACVLSSSEDNANKPRESLSFPRSPFNIYLYENGWGE